MKERNLGSVFCLRNRNILLVEKVISQLLHSVLSPVLRLHVLSMESLCLGDHEEPHVINEGVTNYLLRATQTLGSREGIRAAFTQASE